MPIVNQGGGSGGGGDTINANEKVTALQRSVLDHLRYNADTDQLEADVPVSTTLNSFFLGQQHKISSGSENVFFSNLGSGIDWYPMWGGLKDHTDTSNHDSTGVISPSARTYSTDMSNIEIMGAAHASNITPYATEFTPQVSESVFGLTIRLGQTVAIGDKIEYSIYNGSDNTGLEVYHQHILITSAMAAGELLELWFTHPSEHHAGGTKFAEMTLDVGNAGSNIIPLQVRAATQGTTIAWLSLKYRTFQDKNLFYKMEPDWITAATDLVITVPHTIPTNSHFAPHRFATFASGELTVDSSLLIDVEWFNDMRGTPSATNNLGIHMAISVYTDAQWALYGTGASVDFATQAGATNILVPLCNSDPTNFVNSGLWDCVVASNGLGIRVYPRGVTFVDTFIQRYQMSTTIDGDSGTTLVDLEQVAAVELPEFDGTPRHLVVHMLSIVGAKDAGMTTNSIASVKYAIVDKFSPQHLHALKGNRPR